MECVYCGGNMKETMTTHTSKTKDCVIVIKNIKCEKCSQCGEETYGENEVVLITRIAKAVRDIPLEMVVTDAKNWV